MNTKNARVRSSRSLLACIILACPMLASTTPTHAQTLEQEYERVFANDCASLQLSRDGDGQIRPGQIVGILDTYCRGASSVVRGSVDIFNHDWGNPIHMMGPAMNPRVTSAPDWRDRAVRPRRPKVSADADAIESRNVLIAGVHPGIARAGRDSTYEAKSMGSNFGIVLGGQRWLTDEWLVSLSGSVRDSGHGAATSVVWAPNQRSFGEIRLHFDTVDTKVEREVKFFTESTYTFPGIEQEVTQGHPSRDAFGADISVGYDFETHWLSFGPRIGVEFNRYEQSAHAESLTSYSMNRPLDALPAAIAFDELSEESLTHRIGVNVALLPTRPKSVAPSLELLWVHEYLDVQHVVTGHLAEDIRANPTMLRFQTAERSRDSISARLGFGIRVAPRVTVLVTGEIGYSMYAYYSSGFIGARGKF